MNKHIIIFLMIVFCFFKLAQGQPNVQMESLKTIEENFDLSKSILYCFIEALAECDPSFANQNTTKALLQMDPQEIDFSEYNAITSRISYSDIAQFWEFIKLYVFEHSGIENYYNSFISDFAELKNDDDEVLFLVRYLELTSLISETGVVLYSPQYSQKITGSSITSSYSSHSYLRITLDDYHLQQIVDIHNTYGEGKAKIGSFYKTKMSYFYGANVAFNPVASTSDMGQYISVTLIESKGLSKILDFGSLGIGGSIKLAKWYGLKYNNFYFLPLGLIGYIPISKSALILESEVYYMGYRDKKKLESLPRFLDCSLCYYLNSKKITYENGYVDKGNITFGHFEALTPYFIKIGVQVPLISSYKNYEEYIDDYLKEDVNTQTFYVNIGVGINIFSSN